MAVVTVYTRAYRLASELAPLTNKARTSITEVMSKDDATQEEKYAAIFLFVKRV
jgi:hypothetical protein